MKKHNGMELKKDNMKCQMKEETELTVKKNWWRVRAGPRNKPTQKEREEHEATHVQFRDWCAHCMMRRGRTHHHVAKSKKSEDQSRRPIIATDYHFMKTNLVAYCSNNLRRAYNLHCCERRQTVNRGTFCVEKVSRGTWDNREGGEVH